MPQEDGFHLVVSDNADLSSYYDSILHMFVPYADPTGVSPNVVARVDPWTSNLAFAKAWL